MRILPYRTRDNQIDGVVATFVDMSELKRLDREMRKAKRYSESIVDTVREGILILDGELRVVSANHSFYRLFAASPERTVGKLIFKLGDGEWDIPELRRLLEEIIPEKTSFDSFEVDHEFASAGRKRMLLNARRMEQEGDEPDLILLAMEDVTRN
jgi:PAS domain S-box-containing protein